MSHVTHEPRAILTGLMLVAALSGCNSRADTRPASGAASPALSTYHLRAADLPRPNATPSAMNPARVVPRSEGDFVTLPPGFEAIEAAGDFRMPRGMALLPGGDIALSESQADRITLLRDQDGDGRFERRWAWLDGVNRPFGIAVAGGFVYVGATDKIVRCRFAAGDTVFDGEPQFVTWLTPGGYNNHWTRNLLYDAATNRMYVTVGSKGNVAEEEPIRAAVHVFTVPDVIPEAGVTLSLYASGLRNPVGLAREPVTGTIWTAVNERDGLGDDLVPDYATGLVEGGFYGWPYAYIGPNPQPGALGTKRPDLVAQTLVPDVLFESHSAALGIDFYTGTAFPERYRGGAFVAHHGSWNRSRRTGYKVVYLPFENGKPTGGYEDFMVGFNPDPAAPEVWGRPVGVLMDDDGSLLVSDDGGDVVWRVRYVGER
jgi:glucose/arabinose dehydrogenase